MLKSAAKKCSSFFKSWYYFIIFISSILRSNLSILLYSMSKYEVSNLIMIQCACDTRRIPCICACVHIIRVHSDKQKKGKFALLHTIFCIWRNHIFIFELKQHWPHMIPSSAIIVISVHHMMHSDTISSMRWDVVN